MLNKLKIINKNFKVNRHFTLLTVFDGKENEKKNVRNFYWHKFRSRA